MGMVNHAYNSNIGGPGKTATNSRSTCSTQRVPAQAEIQSDTLSQRGEKAMWQCSELH